MREQFNGIDIDEVIRQEGDEIGAFISSLWGKVVEAAATDRVIAVLLNPETRPQFQELIDAQLRGWGQVYSDEYPALLERVARAASKLAGLEWHGTDIILTEQARLSAARFVAEITEQVRRTVRSAVVDLAESTISRDDAAAILRNVLTLTERESGWVIRRSERSYEATLKEMIESGAARARAEAAARAAAKRAAKAQYAKLHEARIERIIRTESARLKSQGELNAIRIAEQSGQIKDSMKTWERTAYNDNWPSSIINDGITVRYDELFPSGAEYPDEINERCIMTYSFERVTQRSFGVVK